MQIDGARTLITGASGGLGRAIARSFDQGGAEVVLSGRRTDELAGLARSLRRAEVVTAELTDDGGVQRLAEVAGDVDVVIANAGLAAFGRLQDLPLDEVDRMIDVNLRAPIALVHAVLPGMLERGEGHVVLVSSINGRLAGPRMAAYAATKAGLRAFGSSLRQDLHRTGVGVSVICPGPVHDAGMWVDAGLEPPASAGPVRADDVAAAVVHAVQRDLGEVVVASAAARAVATLSQVRPDSAAGVLRRTGAEQLGDQMAAAFTPDPARRRVPGAL